MEVGQYDTAVSDPSNLTRLLAREPPHPVLPRQVKQRAAPKTRLERIPLLSSRTGKMMFGAAAAVNQSLPVHAEHSSKPQVAETMLVLIMQVLVEQARRRR